MKQLTRKSKISIDTIIFQVRNKNPTTKPTRKPHFRMTKCVRFISTVSIQAANVSLTLTAKDIEHTMLRKVKITKMDVQLQNKADAITQVFVVTIAVHDMIMNHLSFYCRQYPFNECSQRSAKRLDGRRPMVEPMVGIGGIPVMRRSRVTG